MKLSRPNRRTLEDIVIILVVVAFVAFEVISPWLAATQVGP